MRRGSPFSVLVEREVLTRLRDRTFTISTIISVLVVIGVAVAPAFFGGSPDQWKVGAVGPAAESAASAAVAIAPEEHDAELVSFADDAALRAAVADGTVDAGIATDGTLIGDASIDTDLQSTLQVAWRQQSLLGALVDAGVSADDATALVSTPPLPVELLDPPDETRDRTVGFVVVGVILLYGQLIGYGFAVASGIVEEKSSRVVEVLLAKVRTRQLLAAKVAGIGLVGFVQLLLLVVAGLVAFVLSGRFELPTDVWPAAATLLAWFVVGFVLYAAMFAVVGALAARAEDLQNSAGPVMLVIAASFIGAVTAGSDPAGRLADVTMFIPTTAPMVAPIRMAAGESAWWEVALSLGVTVATIVAIMRLADLVYRRAALHTNGRLGLRQVLRRAA